MGGRKGQRRLRGDACPEGHGRQPALVGLGLFGHDKGYAPCVRHRARQERACQPVGQCRKGKELRTKGDKRLCKIRADWRSIVTVHGNVCWFGRRLQDFKRRSGERRSEMGGTQGTARNTEERSEIPWRGGWRYSRRIYIVWDVTRHEHTWRHHATQGWRHRL